MLVKMFCFVPHRSRRIEASPDIALAAKLIDAGSNAAVPSHPGRVRAARQNYSA
jgi:hypothetical protein